MILSLNRDDLITKKNILRIILLSLYSCLSTETHETVHAMFTEPQIFIKQSFHREIYEGRGGKTQAAEVAGRYQRCCTLKRD